jgi:hypothetical protein
LFIYIVISVDKSPTPAFQWPSKGQKFVVNIPQLLQIRTPFLTMADLEYRLCVEK